MIEVVKDGEQIQAIIIRSSFHDEGITFFTPGDFSQQLGYMNRPKGHTILPHRHKVVQRKVTLTQEVLVIKIGKVRVDFYSKDQRYLKSSVLETGDVILLASGGHGFEMLERSEIIEVKQGPYIDDDDKIRFDPDTKQIDPQ